MKPTMCVDCGACEIDGYCPANCRPMREEIAELKAENARLREALEKIVLHIPTIGETGRALTCVKDIARAALGDEK